MSDAAISLYDQTYTLRLQTPSGSDAGPVGELEHVLSGDCLSFDSGAGLLSALQALQAHRLPVATEHKRSGQG